MTNLPAEKQNLLSELAALEGRKVCIFGDLGIDQYVDGEVGRISPEAPVPVVEVKNTDTKLGLSGNVAANVKSMGGEPLLVSLVGEDTNAETLVGLLAEKGISTEGLLSTPDRQTTAKLRVMSGQHHLVRVDYESKKNVDLNFLTQHQNTLQKCLQECDVVIVQDYAKGLVNEATCQWVIEQAKGLGKKVIVDPYRNTALSVYQGAHFMTPNRDEAFELAKQIPKPEIWQDVDRIGPALMEAVAAPQMVITLGAEGIKTFDGDKTLHLPTFAKEVFDVTGAGDTVIAAFALGLAADWAIDRSALLANVAAGVVVGHVGAVACDLASLKTELSQ